ncbi:MAG: hypothetical protein RIB67_00140 [Miltoncostaeaceae bacterium]
MERGLSAVCADGALVALLDGDSRAGVHGVPRRRRRGRDLGLGADDVVEALIEAGEDPLVLARSAQDDPGGAALRALASLGGRRLVRLPGDALAAARIVGIAARCVQHSVPAVEAERAVQLLAGAGDDLGTEAAAGLSPARVARWAARAWRACPLCRGGGAPGCRCGVCGGRIPAEAPRRDGGPS